MQLDIHSGVRAPCVSDIDGQFASFRSLMRCTHGSASLSPALTKSGLIVSMTKAE